MYIYLQALVSHRLHRFSPQWLLALILKRQSGHLSGLYSEHDNHHNHNRNYIHHLIIVINTNHHNHNRNYIHHLIILINIDTP